MQMIMLCVKKKKRKKKTALLLLFQTLCLLLFFGHLHRVGLSTLFKRTDESEHNLYLVTVKYNVSSKFFIDASCNMEKMFIYS